MALILGQEVLQVGQIAVGLSPEADVRGAQPLLHRLAGKVLINLQVLSGLSVVGEPGRGDLRGSLVGVPV